MTRLLLSISTAVALGATGCMLSPTDDGRVSSTTAALPFEGFTTQAGAPVQIRAWDFTANAMANVGAPVAAGTAPTAVDGGPLYYWSASRSLPARFWRNGPGGGQCAAVGAQTTVSGGTYNVITVEPDWGDCFNENPSVGGFFDHCQSNNSPVAKIYTNSWGPVTIDQSLLNVAGLVASSQITLTLDNFTPVRGQFCNTGNPGGCPEGLSADPETYQFFAPNASSLTRTGQPPLVFSITPSRHAPMTIYIDNMMSRSLDFTTSGSRFVLGINFETAEPEIRMNCIRDGFCLALGDPPLELEGPRATISFALGLQNGQVVFTDASATFTTTSTSGDAMSAAAAIGAAMTDKINNVPAIHSAIGAALDAVIRQTAGLTAAFSIDAISIGGGLIQVRPGCPLD